MSHRLSWWRPWGGITTYCFVPCGVAGASLRAGAVRAWSACRAAASACPTVATATWSIAPETEATAAGAAAGGPAGACALCNPWPAVASSSTAVTSRRARSCWAAAANGTRHGRPLPLTPATSSTIRQDTSCAQASQTMQTMTSSTNSIGTCPPSGSRGISGIGLPTTATSAAGMPTTMPSSSSAETDPRSTSPPRLTRRVPSIGALDIVLPTCACPSQPGDRDRVGPLGDRQRLELRHDTEQSRTKRHGHRNSDTVVLPGVVRIRQRHPAEVGHTRAVAVRRDRRRHQALVHEADPLRAEQRDVALPGTGPGRLLGDVRRPLLRLQGGPAVDDQSGHEDHRRGEDRHEQRRRPALG